MKAIQKEIKKPWAVYGSWIGAWGIGKVVGEGGKSLSIRYYEDQSYPVQFWSSKWVDRFDNPVKAMAYFLRKNHDGEYNKDNIIDYFLDRFPSQSKNLGKLIKTRTARRRP